jgi:hypothetical protein
MFDALLDFAAWGLAVWAVGIWQRDAFAIHIIYLYALYMGFQTFWSLLTAVMYVINTSHNKTHELQDLTKHLEVWQADIYVYLNYVQPIVDLLVCELAYMLYKELRNITLQATTTATYAGRTAAQRQHMHNNSSQTHQINNLYGLSSYQNQHTERDTEPLMAGGRTGYKPFSGTGHSLLQV